MNGGYMNKLAHALTCTAWLVGNQQQPQESSTV